MWRKQMGRCVLACVLSMGVAGMAWAEDAKPAKPAKAAKVDKADKDAGSKLSGYYAGLARDAELSEATKAKLAEVINARTEAVNKWTSDNSVKVEEARKRVADTKGGDKEAYKKARDEYNAINAQRRAVEDEYDAKIQALLTPEEQVKWQGANLYQYTMRRYKGVTLDDAQKDKIKALAMTAAQDVQKLPTKNESAIRPIRTKLVDEVNANVLTADQKAAMTSKPAAKPAAE